MAGKDKDIFTKFSGAVATKSGSPVTFVVAFLIIITWGVSGPIFGYSDTWQLVINTGTTIVTFLMVFLIQNTQNRDSEALHLKLDELIYINEKANNDMLNLENLSQKELDRIKQTYLKAAEEKIEEIAIVAEKQKAEKAKKSDAIKAEAKQKK